MGTRSKREGEGAAKRSRVRRGIGEMFGLEDQRLLTIPIPKIRTAPKTHAIGTFPIALIGDSMVQSRNSENPYSGQKSR